MQFQQSSAYGNIMPKDLRQARRMGYKLGLRPLETVSTALTKMTHCPSGPHRSAFIKGFRDGQRQMRKRLGPYTSKLIQVFTQP